MFSMDSAGDLHAALVHYPIVLISLAFVFDILYWFQRKEYLQTIGNWLIVSAFIIMIPTAIAGWFATYLYPDNDPDIFRHATMAIVTAAYTLAYAALRGYAIAVNKRMCPYLYLLLSLINVILVGLTAEFGGIVVRGVGLTHESLREPGTSLPYDRIKEK